MSTTHGGEMSSLAAFMETVRMYEEFPVIDHLWGFGKQLIEGLNSLALEAGIAHSFQMQGNAISMNYVTLGSDGQADLALRTLFSQEMIRGGVLMPWIAPSYAHDAVALDQTLAAARQAFRVYAQALTEGSTESLLVGNAIKPVFRQFN